MEWTISPNVSKATNTRTYSTTRPLPGFPSLPPSRQFCSSSTFVKTSQEAFVPSDSSLWLRIEASASEGAFVSMSLSGHDFKDYSRRVVLEQKPAGRYPIVRASRMSRSSNAGRVGRTGRTARTSWMYLLFRLHRLGLVVSTKDFASLLQRFPIVWLEL